MSTTDQVIDEVLGGLIADIQAGDWLDDGDDLSRGEKLVSVVDRLTQIRTQLRSGRGDDWMGLADPLENLALAMYRADQLINREFTPPNWSFIDENIKQGWRKAAYGVLAEL